MTRLDTDATGRRLAGVRMTKGGTAHQAGTARFGTDPANSGLDLNCKASIGAVNPTLTIVANALRLADHIAARFAA